MSDDSSALSLSEQPPTEVDYGSIHDAVMETQRGRWFLHEYAKRNRNADTGMLLAAIERIEAMLRQRALPEAPPPQTRPQPAALADLREIIERARNNLAAIKPNGGGRSASFDNVAASLKAPIAGIRAATGPLQDTAYAMREEGAPDRFCNEIEKRAADLVRDCGELEQTATEVRHIVVLLRDLAGRIEGMDASRTATAPHAPEVEMTAPTPASSEIAEPVAEVAPSKAEPVEPQTIGAGAIPEETTATAPDTRVAEPDRKEPHLAAAAAAQAEPSAPEQPQPPITAVAAPEAEPPAPTRDALTLDPLTLVLNASVEPAAPDPAPAALGFEPVVERVMQAEPAIVNPEEREITKAARDANGKDDIPAPAAMPDAFAMPDADAMPEIVAMPGTVATPKPAFVATPLADPAEFLLEPLPMVEPTPAPSSPELPTPAPPRRDQSDALAPIIALSDEEKIALFS